MTGIWDIIVAAAVGLFGLFISISIAVHLYYFAFGLYIRRAEKELQELLAERERLEASRVAVEQELQFFESEENNPTNATSKDAYIERWKRLKNKHLENAEKIAALEARAKRAWRRAERARLIGEVYSKWVANRAPWSNRRL